VLPSQGGLEKRKTRRDEDGEREGRERREGSGGKELKKNYLFHG
jgi:hypothetical protein